MNRQEDVSVSRVVWVLIVEMLWDLLVMLSKWKLKMSRKGRHIQLFIIAMAAEAAVAVVAAAHTAAEVVRLQAAGCSKLQDEDIAAVVWIQAALQGYLREMRAFRGLLMLQTLMGGYSLKQQVAETLQRMQTRARSKVRPWILDLLLFSNSLEFLFIGCFDVTESNHKPVRYKFDLDITHVNRSLRRQEFGKILQSKDAIRSNLEALCLFL